MAVQFIARGQYGIVLGPVDSFPVGHTQKEGMRVGVGMLERGKYSTGRVRDEGGNERMEKTKIHHIHV